MAALDPNRDIVYPNNSDRATGRDLGQKEPTPTEPAKAKPTVATVQRKQSKLGRVVKDFVVCNAEEAWKNVILPSLKNMVWDTFGGLWWGADNYNRRGRRGMPIDRVSYSTISDTRNTRISGLGNAPVTQRQTRSDFKYDELAFSSREEADVVLDSLMDTIQTYGVARVSDFYDFIGQTCPYTENNYGWKDLSTAKILPDRGGQWYIDFPKPRAL